VLSLLVIPVVYTFIDDLDRFFGGLRKMPKVKLAK
jgi:hypothetical protein